MIINYHVWTVRFGEEIELNGAATIPLSGHNQSGETVTCLLCTGCVT